MSLRYLLADELRHLLRSRLVVIILAALPLVTAAGSLAQTGDGSSTLVFAAFMGSSLAGLVCGALVCTSLIAELQSGAPVLFAVRPIPRFHLLLARFLAMVLTLCATMAAALAVGAALSAWLHPEIGNTLVVLRAGMLLCFACVMLSGSFGVLVGVTASSMLGGVLLFLLVGVQLGNSVMLAHDGLCRWTGCTSSLRDAFILAGSVVISVVLLLVSGRAFARKQL